MSIAVGLTGQSDRNDLIRMTDSPANFIRFRGSYRDLQSEDRVDQVERILCAQRPKSKYYRSVVPWYEIRIVYVDKQYAQLRLQITTGSAVVPHCCKAHAKINRKLGSSTPCTIVTPKIHFFLKLCTCREIIHHANFGFNRRSGVFFPDGRNFHIYHFVTF